MRPVVTRGALLMWLVVVAVLGAACRNAKPAPASATATAEAPKDYGTPLPEVSPTPTRPSPYRPRTIDLNTGQIEYDDALRPLRTPTDGAGRTVVGSSFRLVLPPNDAPPPCTARLERQSASAIDVLLGPRCPSVAWFAVSPDSSAVAFRTQYDKADVSILDIKTGATTVLRRGDVVKWSPTGRYLIIGASSVGSLANEPNTGRQWQLAAGDVAFPWADSDRYIGVVRDPTSRLPSLTLADIETGEYRLLATSSVDIDFPSWRNIGPELLEFPSKDGGVSSVVIDLRSGQQLSRVDGRKLSAERQGLAYALWRDSDAGDSGSLWGAAGPISCRSLPL